jgi:hypothetical protein
MLTQERSHHASSNIWFLDSRSMKKIGIQERFRLTGRLTLLALAQQARKDDSSFRK